MYVSIDNKCPIKKLLTKFEYFFIETWEVMVSSLQQSSSETDFHEDLVNSVITFPPPKAFVPILLLPTFSSYTIIRAIFELSSANAFNLD